MQSFLLDSNMNSLSPEFLSSFSAQMESDWITNGALNHKIHLEKPLRNLDLPHKFLSLNPTSWTFTRDLRRPIIILCTDVCWNGHWFICAGWGLADLEITDFLMKRID